MYYGYTNNIPSQLLLCCNTLLCVTDFAEQRPEFKFASAMFDSGHPLFHYYSCYLFADPERMIARVTLVYSGNQTRDLAREKSDSLCRLRPSTHSAIHTVSTIKHPLDSKHIFVSHVTLKPHANQWQSMRLLEPRRAAKADVKGFSSQHHLPSVHLFLHIFLCRLQT